jgi:hypothetical protein
MVGASAAQVCGPTIPSTPSAFAVWKALAASTVEAPKTASAAAVWPLYCSRYWIASTSAPRLPLLCVGKNALA